MKRSVLFVVAGAVAMSMTGDVPHARATTSAVTPATMCGLFSDDALACHAVPAFRGGRPYGLKVLGVRPGSQRARLGFRNGDVVVRMNGVELVDPSAAASVVAALGDRCDVTFDVERRGESVQVHVSP